MFILFKWLLSPDPFWHGHLFREVQQRYTGLSDLEASCYLYITLCTLTGSQGPWDNTRGNVLGWYGLHPGQAPCSEQSRPSSETFGISCILMSAVLTPQQ